MKDYLYKLATDQKNDWLAKSIKLDLRCASFVYGWLADCAKAVTKPTHLSRKVISVGNITWGGTGKTPLLEFLITVLKDRGIKPVVLTRGYKASKDLNGQNDETKLLKQAHPDVPVLAGSDRVANAVEYLKSNSCDVFLLDDGFQHWKLSRDLDIVVINAINPFGNRALIPRGILREPVRSLKRAGIIVLSKVDQANPAELENLIQEIRSSNPDSLIVKAVHRPVSFWDIKNRKDVPLQDLKGKEAVSFSSIGDPGSFLKLVLRLGVHLNDNISFLDHHLYIQGDIDRIDQMCKATNSPYLITTTKDAVKLPGVMSHFDKGLSVLALKVKLEILEKEEEFLKKILSVMNV